jgi:hypothetical protein
VCSLVRACQEKLDSQFHPSFGKLLKVLSSAQVKPAEQTLLHLAAEHDMLHLGKSKYREKKFESIEKFLEESDALTEQPLEAAAPAAQSSSESTIPVNDGAGQKLVAGAAKRRAPEACDVQPQAKRPAFAFETNAPHLRNPVARGRIIEPHELSPYLPSWQGLDMQNPRHIGRWGESLVHNYLRGTMQGWTVEWVNESKEQLSAYDLHIIRGTEYRSSRFIEVKTSRYGDKNTFEISLNEFEFFSQNRGESVNFDIYRVYSAGDPARVRIEVISNPLKLLKEQQIHLCIAI